MNVNNPSRFVVQNHLDEEKMSLNQKFFGQKNLEPKWHFPSYATESLNFDEFDVTWAFAPERSMSPQQRFEICDLSENDNNNLPYPINKYSKYNYRFEDGYHLLDTVPVDTIRSFGKDRKVLYKYNSEWFRSEEFKTNHDGLHIVFHGCSNTEGIGANIENTWSHMLYNELSKTNKISGYYNLGRSGAGWHRIIQNFMVYVNKYGAPNYLFVLHPNILRNFIWNDEGTGWRYTQLNPWGETNNLDENISIHREQFPVWAISWKLFIEYCKSIGTQILWSTWDTWETENILNTPFFDNTFFPINTINNEIVKKNYMEFVDRDDAIWARDGHDGYVQQYHWFKMFLNEINKRNIIK